MDLGQFQGPYAMNDALEALVGEGWRVARRGDGRAHVQRRWQAVNLTFVAPGRVEQRPALSNWTLAVVLTAAAVTVALCYALAT